MNYISSDRVFNKCLSNKKINIPLLKGKCILILILNPAKILNETYILKNALSIVKEN